MKSILLGLGSNRSFCNLDSLQILNLACEELRQIVLDPVFSSVYKTKAMYVTDQEDFYNMAVYGFVPDEESPYKYLDKIHKIEEKYGRDRQNEIRFGSRSLDIDIEKFGNIVSNDPALTLPHPRIKERAFVLVPALEILPEPAENKLREEFSKALNIVGKGGVQKL
ncbi:MAG: 2-amino-4-hydroxy-6-hydroxymethyldihydropteridine diphosphokinase [Treponema sp.]|nr:2-amino-4-hydroxy-6-hydroxymethyldihydropteridine diphosphokinase [Treponema sp.]